MNQSIAPGKLILSGEHAVCHGAPALAMAVDRFANASINTEASSEIAFNLQGLKYKKSHTLESLRELKRRVKKDYHAFLRGEFGIRDVLKKPFELSHFVLTNLLDRLNLPFSQGFQVQTHSDIPVGCGMGSSAAMILSVLRALSQHYELNLSDEQFLHYGLEAENLQHGQSSGLDLHVSLHGGCVLFQQGRMTRKPIPELPLYLVNTGSPASTTGECVSHTQSALADPLLIQAFSDVTFALEQAIEQQDIQAMQQAIRDNHGLLTQLGVVPPKVQHFIKALEQWGAAAKICGAGSIRGEQAGVLIILTERDPSALCTHYQYQCMPLQGESRGLRGVEHV